jgi:NAD(P)-binding Rossmann-like domain
MDVAVIGGGQAALAAGFFLRRTGLSFALLDDEPAPGGAWQHGWPSLRLFSPARWSSLPGWIMPEGTDRYPSRDETLAYLAACESRYALPVKRPVRVLATGFKPALAHLAPLAVPDAQCRLAMQGNHAAAHPHLFPLGYGDWTGFVSATLIGVGRAAKAVVEEITRTLASESGSRE